MTITAQLEEMPSPDGGRRAPRLTLRLETRGSAGAGVTDVLVHNISATGLLLESDAALMVGGKFDIDLPHAGATQAKVVWASGKLFGCQFHTPLSPAALSAAQLRGQAGMNAPAPFRRAGAPGESFGVRLQRLRKERGLTLAQVAEGLQVSKPTIWAWENGKARPLGSRMKALAAVLGVTPAQLRDEGSAGDLPDLLARSRERIAEAVGTSPDKVRIMIEL